MRRSPVLDYPTWLNDVYALEHEVSHVRGDDIVRVRSESRLHHVCVFGISHREDAHAPER